MPEPVAFVSHFRVREGKADALRTSFRGVTARLKADKPQTLAFLSFVDDEERLLSILHVFADADGLDAHLVGARERAQSAYELIEPMGWDLYGTFSDAALESMRQSAAAAGVPLTVKPRFVMGFVRAAPG